MLASRRVLIVLDNAASAAQVRPLLPGGSGCLVLVTSRRRLDGLVVTDGAQPVHLGALTTAESRQLLSGFMGADRLAAEPSAVTELVGLCAGLPLALCVAGARAQGYPQFPLAALAAELGGRRGPGGARAPRGARRPPARGPRSPGVTSGSTRLSHAPSASSGWRPARTSPPPPWPASRPNRAVARPWRWPS